MRITQFHERRRSKLEIMVDILREARKPATKTRIMYQCNLSFKQLKRYLRFMRLKGFIWRKERTGRVTYQITEKGRSLVGRYNEIVLLLQL